MDNNKRNITLKIFVNETEELFIKGCLQKINNNIDLKNISNKFKIKQKSLSEFLRETILNYLLKNESYDNDINSKLNQIEKYVKRNLSLTFKNTEKIFGNEEAKNILNNIKNME